MPRLIADLIVSVQFGLQFISHLTSIVTKGGHTRDSPMVFNPGSEKSQAGLGLAMLMHHVPSDHAQIALVAHTNLCVEIGASVLTSWAKGRKGNWVGCIQ